MRSSLELILVAGKNISKVMCFLSSVTESVDHIDIATTEPSLACQGLYDAAFDVIKSASERFPSPCRESSLWMRCEQQIRFTTALHRGRLNAAERAINNLASVSRLDADYW